MYTKQAYKDLTREKLEKQIRAEGFDPMLIHDRPGFFYSPHEHPETKLLVFVEGTMEVHVQGKRFQCGPGDKLIIAGNTTHSALVGPEGCIFYWSEKLI